MQKEPSEEHNLKYRMKSRPLNANIEGKKKHIDIIGAAFSGKCNNAKYVIGVAHEPDEPPQIFKTLQKWNAPIYPSVCIKNNYWDERSMKTEFEHKNHKYEPKYM